MSAGGEGEGGGGGEGGGEEGEEGGGEGGGGEQVGEQNCGNSKCIMCTTLDRRRGGERQGEGDLTGRERLCTPEKVPVTEAELVATPSSPPPPPLPKKTVAPYQEYR